IGFYVTAPDATLPMGPGPVDGKTYWTLQTADFPNGFGSPVTYGVVPDGAEDTSQTSDAPKGGAELTSGTCYRFSVVTTEFNTAHYVWQKP
ncbi:MAG: hypothetical protein ABEN55_11880, partial [Bradymonadaceae bacterium]